MAIVKDPVAKARAARTENQAAQLRDELVVELSLTDDEQLPAGWADEAEEALRIIDERFPEHESVPFGSTSTGRDRTPSMSHHAKRALADDGHTAPEQQHKAAAAAKSSPRAGSARGKRPAPGRRSGGTSVARRAARATGLPQQATSAGRSAMKVLGAALGLTFLYLVLSNAQKSGSKSAVALFSRGVETATRAFVAPVDPLSPNAKKTKAATAAGATPTPRRRPSRPSPARRPSHTP